MTNPIRPFLAGAAVCVSLSSAFALECPVLTPLDGTAGPSADLTRQLASAHVLTQIPGILGHLHQVTPAASRQQLVDYLIAAYCPVVQSTPNLEETLKQAKLNEFANAAIASEY